MENNQSRRSFIQKSLAAGIGLSFLEPAAVFAKNPK